MTAYGLGYQAAEREWAITLAALNGDNAVDLHRPLWDDDPEQDRRDEQRGAALDDYLDEREQP